MNETPEVYDFVFYTRGRGRGHAVRDLRIANWLRKLKPDVTILFVSYGTGASVLFPRESNVIELDLSEMPTFESSLIAIAKLLKDTQCRLLVAQEEPSALVAARIYGIPAVLQTHWFPPSWSCNIAAYSYADSVLFTEDAGIFPEPEQVRGQVVYVGAILRPFEPGVSLRPDLRERRGIEETETLVLVLPGSFPEKLSPVAHLIRSALALLRARTRLKVIWSAGAAYEDISRQFGDEPDIQVVNHLEDIDQWMRAADVILSKGTYNITKEAERAGCPHIVLTHHANPVDDIYSERAENCVLLSAKETSPMRLASTMQEAFRRRSHEEEKIAMNMEDGSESAAKYLLSRISHLR